MGKSAHQVSALGLLVVALLVSGCGVSHSGLKSPPGIPAGRQGVVHGGQQPVSGATIQLYAVGTTGDASAATPLLSPAVTTDANGGFTITGLYTCPSASALVYLVATGGNPGLGGGGSNPQLAMMTALGPCGNLSSSTYFVIDELTTVAAVYALAPFMSAASAVGSTATDAAALAAAFNVASELVNSATGGAPGTGVPVGTTVPVAQIDTIGDILSGCVNTAGGAAGDTTACGQLFSLTTLSGTAAATDTITALLHLAESPELNTGALYNLAPANGPFQPSLLQAPPDLSVRLLISSGFTVSPGALTFPDTRMWNTSAPLTLTFTNNTAVPVGIDPTLPVSGNNFNDFLLASSGSACTFPIEPGVTCTESFTFTPAGTGMRRAYLTLANTSANPVIGIPLSGQGLETNAGPAFLSPTAVNLTDPATPGTVTLTNSGSTTLTIDGFSISNDPISGQPAFTQTNTCGPTLASQGTCTITVTALATTQTYSTGVLTATADMSNGPRTVNLSYSNGFSGPVLFDFGGRSVGTEGVGNINGISGYPAGSVTFTLSGADAADFAIPPPYSVCTPSRLSPLCGFTVDFTPSALGRRTATVNANGVPIGGVIGVGLAAGIQFSAVYPYNGYGAPPTPASTVDFHSIAIGQTSTAATVEILNTGTVPLTLNAPVLGGANAGDFGVVSQCTSSIAPNGSCALTVTATPMQPTNRYATLTLSDSTHAAQQTVSLKVLGVNPGPVATPNSVTFPYQPLGTVSASQTFTVTSYNNDPVYAVVQDGPYLPFVLTGASSCPATPCQMSLAFAPTALNTASSFGNSNAYANVNIVDLYSGQYIWIQATGALQPPPVTSWTVLPTSLTFAAETVGTTSLTQNITLTNTGNQTIDYSIQQSNYVNFNDYTVTNGCGGVVTAGATCTVGVKFSPLGTGTRTYTLKFLSNAPTSPDVVQVSGTGQ